MLYSWLRRVVQMPTQSSWGRRRRSAVLFGELLQDRTVPTFIGPSNYPVAPATGGAALAVAAGDFNGDGKLDLVVTTGLGTLLLAGNGDGTFAPASLISSVTGSVTVGDVNGDDKLDVVVTNGFTVSVILNNGDGTWAIPMNYLVGAPLNAVVLGDFNGDGLLDLAAAASVFGSPGNITVFLNHPA